MIETFQYLTVTNFKDRENYSIATFSKKKHKVSNNEYVLIKRHISRKDEKNVWRPVKISQQKNGRCYIIIPFSMKFQSKEKIIFKNIFQPTETTKVLYYGKMFIPNMTSEDYERNTEEYYKIILDKLCLMEYEDNQKDNNEVRENGFE